MEIIPSINCENFYCVKERMEISADIFDKRGVFDPWVHIDIADGSMTSGYKTWDSLADLVEVEDFKGKIALHIMAKDPGEFVALALKYEVDRVIVHVESEADIGEISKFCKKAGVELMLAINYSSELKKIYPFLNKKLAQSALVLSVPPGLSGQPFKRKALEHIKKLRSKYPKLIIEVDGGINPAIAGECMSVGASQVAVSSFLFGAADELKAYTELKVAA